MHYYTICSSFVRSNLYGFTRRKRFALHLPYYHYMWTLLYKGLKCTQDKLLKMFIIAVVIINYTHEQSSSTREVNDDQFFFSRTITLPDSTRLLVIKLQQIHVRMRQGRRKQRAAVLHTNRFVYVLCMLCCMFVCVYLLLDSFSRPISLPLKHRDALHDFARQNRFYLCTN